MSTTNSKNKKKSMTKDVCLGFAKNFDSATKWYNGHRSSWKAAKKYGWYAEATSHMMTRHEAHSRSGLFWTKSRCFEEAKKHKTIKSWRDANRSSYNSAFKQGLVKEIWEEVRSLDPSILVKRLLTKEECFQEACKHRTKHDWNKKDPRGYRTADRNGWLDEIWKTKGGTHRKTNITFSKDDCWEEAKLYSSKKEWSENGILYQYAKNKKWINELICLMAEAKDNTNVSINIREIRDLSKESCIKESLKYSNRSDFINKSQRAYKRARDKGWLEECYSHMEKKRHRWTEEECINEALKYDEVHFWREANEPMYSYAFRKGWLKECTAHMKKPRTLEECKADALKYNSREQWCIESPFYYTAYNKGWMDICCEHMTKYANTEQRERPVVTKLYDLIISKTSAEVHREERLDRGYPDLTLIINGKYVIVEVKHDKSKWSKKEINHQLEKYEESAKNKYKNNFHSVLLTSPNGRYGISFKELIKKLKDIK